MMTAQEVRQLLTGGGSKTGIHYYYKVATCAAQAQFEAEAREQGDYSYSINREVGTVFHKLREQYHNKQGITIPKEDPDGDVTITAILTEAHRAFDFYCTYMPANHIGTVIGQEIELAAKIPGDGNPFTLADDSPVLSGRLDLVVEVGVEGTKCPGCPEPLKPGIYLWDDKTHDKKPSHLFVEDSHSLQFMGYHWLWKTVGHPLKNIPLAGTLVHHLVRHTDMGGDWKKVNGEKTWVPDLNKSVIVSLLPPPTEEEFQRVFNFVRYAKYLEELHARVGGCFNVSACNNFAGCAFRANGRCNFGVSAL